MEKTVIGSGTRTERIEIVNKIIQLISKKGRKFFLDSNTGAVSHFYLSGEKNKRLWFLDKRGGRVNPYPSNLSRDDHFSDGGTLWSLIHEFREFILTGKQVNGKYGYGGLYCPHWGYSEQDMSEIRKVAIELGYLREGK